MHHLRIRLEFPGARASRFIELIIGPHNSAYQRSRWREVFCARLDELNAKLDLGVMTCITAEFEDIDGLDPLKGAEKWHPSRAAEWVEQTYEAAMAMIP